MIMETAVAMMAKPFIEGIVKDVIIPKIIILLKKVLLELVWYI